ncbi:MAG: Crp/Fnr family transcriptional regulator [Flavobacteriales bacterium]|jgi:CRP-like cAMP-binding protein
MDSVRKYFSGMVVLNDEEWEAFSAGLRRREIRKKSYLLEAGQDCSFIAFVEEGTFRFYHQIDGEEKITAFFFQHDFVTNYRSFLTGEPSSHHIEALTDSAVWSIQRDYLFGLYDRFPKLDRLGRYVAENLYLRVASRLDTFLYYTPAERYEALVQRNSRLLQEVPQYMLASYLGVTAESLSRIRARK